MTIWLELHEKVQQHSAFIEWWQWMDDQQSATTHLTPIGPPQVHPCAFKMTRNPSVKKVSFDCLAEKYGAIDFQDALANFILQINHPHKIKFTTGGDSMESDIADVIFVWPEQNDMRGHIIPSRFDTVVRGKEEGQTHGNNGEYTPYCTRS